MYILYPCVFTSVCLVCLLEMETHIFQDSSPFASTSQMLGFPGVQHHILFNWELNLEFLRHARKALYQLSCISSQGDISDIRKKFEDKQSSRYNFINVNFIEYENDIVAM